MASLTHQPLTIPLPHGGVLDLARPGVMGVINVTPDSFSDGGRHLDPQAAIEAGLQMVADGAVVLDVGGESTRPGAARVPEGEETRRVLPVIEGLLAAGVRAPISIDTRKAEVAREALAAGAVIVNDISGLADPEMAATTVAAGAALILGHIQGLPESMQRDPTYGDVVDEVHATLAAARERALAAGVPEERILIDPGIGFGKTLEHNLTLLARLESLSPLGPLVIGISRKSMLGALLDQRPVGERLAGGLGGAVFAALAGARLIRAHDVLPTVDALRVAWAIRSARNDEEVHRVA